MTKSFTNKGLFVLLLAVFCSWTASAQFWTENFNSAAAFNAWTAASTGAGAEVWNRSTDVANAMGFSAAPVAFAAPTAAQGFAFYNSDANGQGNIHDVTLTSPAINCATHANVGLRFNSQFADFTGSDAEVRVSTDGGNTWTAYPIFDNQPSYGIGQAANVPANILTEMQIPAANSQANVRVQFRWSGEWEYGWKLDDIALYDYVAPTVDVTFRVNVSLLPSVDPAGVRLAGSFNGFTDELMTNAGNGVWTITKNLNIGETVTYKFKNGPSGWEQAPAACGVNDGFGGYNRALTVPGTTTTLSAVCFASCDPCVLPCNLNPDALVCDNFETYNVGNLSPQSTNWIPWDLVETSAVGAEVSTEFASQGTKSMKVKKQGNGDDQLLLLGQNAGEKTTGRYSLKWKMYIPAGKAAYFNVQGTEITPGTVFAIENYFLANKSVVTTAPSADTLANGYPQDAWFQWEGVFDLDNNIAKFYINGNLYKAWGYTQNLGAIDFYSADATYLFYVDEVELVKLPNLVFNVDNCATAVDLTPYFGGNLGAAQTTGLFDNTTATVDASDPVVDCWNESATVDIINGSMWYTFSGDGEQYHIETVPCNATNYIGTAQQDLGDTQMAIYTGACGDYTLVACNDDLFSTGQPDWRSAVDLITTEGETYYMLIDGFDLGGGQIAVGEFCIEITRGQAIDCDAGAVGTTVISNGGFICQGGNLTDVMQPNINTFVLPTIGPVSGNCWCISTAPLTPGEWPGTTAGIASTTFGPNVVVVNLPNDGTAFAVGEYYLTAVVLGGGTLIDPAQPSRIFNVDPTGGCFFVGESQLITLLPAVDPLTVSFSTTPATNPPGNNGAIALSPEGGYPGLVGDPSLYNYTWSNGATTQNLSGIPGGSYTVTVSDPTTCADPVTVVIGLTTSVEDPASVKSLTISPNPTSGALQLNLSLVAASDVSIQVVNTLGQAVQNAEMGKVSNLSHTMNLANLPNGTYFLRVTVDGETAVRRVAVQR
jgi:hypothetical protein